MKYGFKKSTLIISALALIFAILFSVPVSAAEFYSYIYDNDEKAVAAPDAATPAGMLTGENIGGFNSPQDLYAYNGRLYIADTKNNRIVIMGLSGSNTEIIADFKNNGREDRLSEPTGICVTADGIYIADTGNARVIKLNENKECTLVIETPNEDSFGEDFNFSPTKVAVDDHERIFVISAGYNMGLIQFDKNGGYLKSIGAPKVTLSVIEQFWRKLSTKEQRERSQSVVPTEYSNLSVSSDGFIYVTNESTSEEVEALRRLNAKGNDVLKRIGEPAGDVTTGGLTYKGNSAIIDFCELEYGNFAILDRKRSRVFVYNESSELLYVFGGPGTYSGGMSVPTSMVYSGGRFYISDSGRNAVCVYELTEYGRLFGDVAKAQKNIDSDSEEAGWNEIMKNNSNCILAMNGIANAAYKRHDMKTAMKYYKMAGNRTDYSKAYAFVRREYIEGNIAVIAIAIVALIAAAVLVSKWRSKNAGKISADSALGRIGFIRYVCYHPLKGYWEMKREKRGSVAVSAVILGAAVVVMTASNLFAGFIFNTNNLQTYNMFGMSAFLIGAVFIWCIAQWCVTSLMNGEGKFGDIFIATCTALWPYIVINTVAILLSRVLLKTEGDFYYVLAAAAIIYSVALIIVSVMQTHNFTAAKTALAILITVVVILLMVFIGMLVVALCQQLIAFVKDISTEVILRI